MTGNRLAYVFKTSIIISREDADEKNIYMTSVLTETQSLVRLLQVKNNDNMGVVVYTELTLFSNLLT